MAFTTTFANKILEHFIRRSSQSVPAGMWLALSSTAPQSDGTGVTEPAAGDYDRKTFTSGAASNRTVTNSGAISFVASAASAWGQLPYAALYDDEAATSASNVIMGGRLEPALSVGVGAPVSVAIGQLVIDLPWATL